MELSDDAPRPRKRYIYIYIPPVSIVVIREGGTTFNQNLIETVHKS